MEVRFQWGPHVLWFLTVLGLLIAVSISPAMGEEVQPDFCGTKASDEAAAPTLRIGEPVARFSHGGLVNRIVWNAEQTRLASAFGSVRLWSFPEGKTLYESPYGLGTAEPHSLAFVGDQLVFPAVAAFGGNSALLLEVIDARDGKPLHTVPADVETVLGNVVKGVSTGRADGLVAVLFRPSAPILRLYNRGNWADYTTLTLPSQHLPDGVWYDQLAMTSDGKYLLASASASASASGTGTRGPWEPPPKTNLVLDVDVWDIAARRIVRRFETFGPGRDPGGEHIELNRNGVCVAISAIFFKSPWLRDEVKVGVWDIETGKRLRDYLGPLGHVQDVTWSPDGRFIAAAAWAWENDDPGGIFVWDAASAVLVAKIPSKNTGGSSAVAFSPDGKFIAYGDNSTVFVAPITGVNPN